METDRKWLHRLLRIAAAAVWVGIIVYGIIHRNDFTLDEVLHYTPKNPFLAFVVLMLLFALKSLTVVFYSGILYAAAGILFPLPVAIAVNICGTLVMALLSYYLGMGLGAEHADHLREKYPKLHSIERIRNRNRFAFVVILRCINIVNFDIGSIYCGAVRLPLAPFLVGSTLGKLTDLAMFSVMGTSAIRRDPIPVLIALVIDLTIAFVIAFWSKKQNTKEAEKHD